MSSLTTENLTLQETQELKGLFIKMLMCRMDDISLADVSRLIKLLNKEIPEEERIPRLNLMLTKNQLRDHK